MTTDTRLTAKQEGFCQSSATGELNQSECYRANFNCSSMLPATVANEAYKLLSRHDIAARIAEIKEPVASELRAISVHTAETLVAKYEKILKGAIKDHAWAPANKSVEGIARLTGNLDGPERAAEIKITKVTVVLPPSAAGAVVDVEEYTVSGPEEEIEGP